MASRSPTDNKSSIALLRRLRAGGDDVHFVHRIDVCTAPPEALVADLEPVPGTGLDDDGCSRIWYFYHVKKYNNTRGDTSGYRKRAVTGGGGGTAWHSETSRKDVQGSNGGTFCTFSYGRKMGSSAKSIVRMGWCMTEYDLAATDEQQDAAAASNYVLCKVYRSPRAKGKSAPVPASSSNNASSKTAAKKRKVGGEHPEAPPAKLIQQPEYVQQPDFDFNIEDINFYLDENAGSEHLEAPPPKSSIQQQEPQVQQQTAYCHQREEVGVQQTAGPGMESSEHRHGGDNFNIEDFNVEEYMDILEMMRNEPEPEPGLQQPTIAKPEHDGRFIELPCGPVLATEVTAEDTTTTYGHCNSYAPSWLHTTGIGTAGCSSRMQQHQGSSLRLPYLMC